MAPNRYSRQWNAALAAIAAAIEQARYTQAVRLPSVKALAASAGVSPLTMWRAARSVCEQGALTSIPRGGFVLTAKSLPAQISEPHGPQPPAQLGGVARWRSVMDALQGDIEIARLSPQPELPSQKALAARYRTSAGSMRRALRELEHVGIIERAAHGHVIRSDSPFGATATIVVTARVALREECHHMSPHSTELWRNLDMQCQRRNVCLRLTSVGQALRALGRRQGSLYHTLVSDRSVLGHIVLTLGFSELEATQLCGFIARGARPVALIDELGQPYMADAALQTRGQLFHLGGGSLAGRLMGEHLARMGHRDVCWISPAHGEDDTWVTQRLQGLREGLAAGGRTSNIEAHVLDTFSSMAEISPAMRRDPLFDRLTSQLKQIPSQIPPDCPAIDSLFVNRAATNYLWFRFIRREMEPLFSRLLASSRATAWVTCNDEIATMALDFLQRRRVPVPGRIALAGFDDGELSQTRNITSYNFNVATTVQRAVDLVVGSARAQRPPAHGIETPGFVSVRSSTARRL